MTVGELIRKTRLEKGMTQKQVAERCGMADSAIRKYESGQITPKYDTLQRIAVALEVNRFDLIPEEKAAIEYVRNRSAELETWSERRDEIGQDLSKLNDEGQLEAVKRVKELTEIDRYKRKRKPSPLSAGIKVYGDGPAGSFPPAGPSWRR